MKACSLLYHNIDKDTYYQTIQASIDDADPGNTIVVSAGTYYESIVINKTLTLIGEDRNTTIIDGNGTGDVVWIEANYVNLSGFTIRSSGPNWEDDSGIELRGASNCIISSCYVANNTCGIYLVGGADRNKLVNCTVSASAKDGVFIYSCAHNVIENCNLSNNADDGIDLDDASDNLLIDCTLSANGADGIYLYASNYNLIERCSASRNENNGIELFTSSYNSVRNCTLSENAYRGALIRELSNLNQLVGCAITMNLYGVQISRSSATQLLDCNVSSNSDDGIYLSHAQNANQFLGCSIVANGDDGIDLCNSSRNLVARCTIAMNANCGILLRYGSNDNELYNNNLIDNALQAFDNCTNTWDDGYPAAGNYWSDYAYADLYSGAAQDVVGRDGIGDMPYAISGGGNQDRYPLFYPCRADNTPPEAYIDVLAPNPADENTSVRISGHGNDTDGCIVAYNWSSDLDGILSDSAEFNSSTLAVGVHNISFSVKDDDGAWSEPVYMTLTIIYVNRVPSVTILAPGAAEMLNVTVVISGVAADSDGEVTVVHVRIDDDAWALADGTTSWQLDWDTCTVANGKHTLYARAYDGESYSQVVNVTVYVSNMPNRAPVAELVCHQGIDALDYEPAKITLRGESTVRSQLVIVVYDIDALIGNASIIADDDGASAAQCPAHLMNASRPYRLSVLYHAGDDGDEDEGQDKDDDACRVWLDIEIGGISLSLHFAFNASDGAHQTRTFNLTELLDFAARAVGLVRLDASDSHDPDGHLTGYVWRFENGTTGSGMFIHTAYRPGNHTVYLTATDDEGLSTTVSENLAVRDMIGHYVAYKQRVGVRLACPANLVVIDEHDRALGYDAIAQTFENRLPNSTMIRHEDVEVYLMPQAGTYTYRVMGSGLGVYALDMFYPQDHTSLDYQPSELDRSEYSGITYAFGTSLAQDTADELTISPCVSVLNITCNVDKFYGLSIQNGSDEFTISAISMNAGAIHSYTVTDWALLSTDEPSITLYVDKDGDGRVDKILQLYNGLRGTDLFRPDLMIIRVNVSNERPGAGERVMFDVVLKNIGDGPAQDVSIWLYCDDALVHSSELELVWLDRTALVSLSWHATEGEHTLRVLVEVAHDTNEQNNEHNVIIAVAPERTTTHFTPGTTRAIASVAGICGGILLLLALVSELGKYKLFTTLVPLYTKIKKSKVLDNYTRGKIHGYIIANPGAHYNLIKRALALTNGTLAYHLSILERQEMIKAQSDGFHKRFYPMGMKTDDIVHLTKSQEELIERLRAQPGLSQKELAAKLGVSRQVINYYVRIMSEMNIIKVTKTGKTTRCYLQDTNV